MAQTGTDAETAFTSSRIGIDGEEEPLIERHDYKSLALYASVAGGGLIRRLPAQGAQELRRQERLHGRPRVRGRGRERPKGRSSAR